MHIPYSIYGRMIAAVKLDAKALTIALSSLSSADIGFWLSSNALTRIKTCKVSATILPPETIGWH